LSLNKNLILQTAATKSQKNNSTFHALKKHLQLPFNTTKRVNKHTFVSADKLFDLQNYRNGYV